MKKLLPIFIFLILLSGKILAQQQLLLKQLKQTKPDSTRLRILNDLGMLYKNRHHDNNLADLDTAKSWFLKALPLSSLAPDSAKFGRSHLLINLGEIAFNQHNIAECKSYFEQSIAYSQRKHELANEAEGWERLGNTLSFTQKNCSGYFTKAIGLYQKVNRTDRVIYNYFLYALDKGYSGQMDSAIKIAVQVIEKYKNTRLPNLEMLYYVASAMNRTNGNLDKALYYSLGGVHRMVLMKDTTKGGTLYGELAEVYQDIGDIDNSIYYYKKTIVIREKKNPKQKFIFEIGRAVVKMLIKQKKAAEGLKFITDLEHKHPPDSEFDAGLVAQVKAYCYEALGLSAMAEKNYQIMMKGLGDDNNSDIGQIAREDIALFYINQKNTEKAAYYLKSLKKEEDAMRSKELELLFFKIDSINGNLYAAIDHFQRYKVINDSIFNFSKTKQLQQLQVEFETEKKNKDIAIYKNDITVQQNKIQQANYMRNVTLAGVVVLALFLALLYNGYRFKQRKNEDLNQLVGEKDELLVEKDSLLVEKQWLLKEIHHRVKNNLAIVMGLLNRQSAYIDNEVALAAIQNSQNRMRSIALIHQKLYQSENLDLIAMPDYIDELIGHLKDSFDLGTRIIFEKQLEDLSLDVSQAVPLGLIINETVTNSIKYAYPGQTPGIIRIKLIKGDRGENILEIKDYGPGLKKGFDPEKMDSMGMNLMRGLSKQLGGALEMSDDNGVLIVIRFKTEVFIATSSAMA